MRLRTRIFLGLASLSIGVVGLTWILSLFLLEPFYLAQKRTKLQDISREIGELPASIASANAKLSALERSTTVHISVVSPEGRIVYDTSRPIARPNGEEASPPGMEGRLRPFAPITPSTGELPGFSFALNKGPRPPTGAAEGAKPPLHGFGENPDGPVPNGGPRPRIRTAKHIESSKNGTFFETQEPGIGVRLLFLTRRQASGATLVLSFPLAQIKESARAAMGFFSLSSALALVMAALLSYLFAKSVTRPFGELIALSRSIGSLDFSRRFVSSRRDEVAVLGGAMNELSDSLQQALAELERSNARLREDVEREKRVDAMRREFISNVSHELKTPIALILGYAEGIQEGVPDDLAARDAYLAVIIDEARKMDSQVRDLLELSQIDSGVLPLRLEDFDLRELVSETLASFGKTLGEYEVEPELALEESSIRGDKGMLGRAFVNYLSNAISHLDEHRRLAIDLSRQGDGVELSIFNSGPWIPEKALELIWQSYYKVDPSRKREFGGTGLGLAIVRGIISRHDGTCSVENLEAEGDKPRGVRFAFWVPCGGPKSEPILLRAGGPTA